MESAERTAAQLAARERPLSRGAFSRPPTHSAQISFGECDPAGIMFAPRYFELYGRAIEAFYTKSLDLDHRDIVQTRRIGLAYVSLSSQYFRSISYGDIIDIYVSVGRIGKSSFALALHMFHGAHEVARGRTVNVATDLHTMRAAPLPDDVRQALEAYKAACGD
jgi:4-hydroxybenzoyl-CoA thioesterase